ncbi:MAG TPA: hypothetical protein VIJ42_12625 [Stellaceae bacterium]
MWKDWLERTLTRNNAPVMLASEILCPEPANGNAASETQAEPKPAEPKRLEPV